MDKYEPQDELLRLFDTVLSEEADDLEFKRLEQLLDEDSQVREQFALTAQLDSEIRHVFRTGALNSEISRADKLQPPHIGTVSSRSTRRTLWLLPFGLAAAAMLLVVAFHTDPTTLDDHAQKKNEVIAHIRKPPAPVATLELGDGIEREGVQLSIGDQLYEGDTVWISDSDVRISMGCGAEIVTDVQSTMTFVSRDRVRLLEGEVAVDVASWAKGFTIETEDLEVVDLGTTFSVSASKERKTRTSVHKGLVRVHPRHSGSHVRRGILIAEGEAFATDGRGRLSKSEEVSASLLELLNSGSLKPYRPVELHNTGHGIQVGDEDSQWQVALAASEGNKSKHYAVVCGPHERYLANNPDTSQWVSVNDWKRAPANSLYTFQTKFDLTGYDLSTTQVFGRFLADNGIQAVRVNGKLVEVESWVDNQDGQTFDNPQFRFVNVTDGLSQFENVIEIDVWNGTMQNRRGRQEALPNPMALRVEWYAFGRQSVWDQ